MKRISNIIESEVEPVKTNSYWYNTIKKKLYRFGNNGWEEIGKQSYARRKSSKRSYPTKPIVGWIHGLKLNINNTVADKYIVKGSHAMDNVARKYGNNSLLLTDTALKACTIKRAKWGDIKNYMPQYVQDLYDHSIFEIACQYTIYPTSGIAKSLPWEIQSVLESDDGSRIYLPSSFAHYEMADEDVVDIRFYCVINLKQYLESKISLPQYNSITGEYNTEWEWQNRDVKNFLIHHAVMVNTDMISTTENLLGCTKKSLMSSISVLENLDAIDPWKGEPIIFRDGRYVTASKSDKYILARPHYRSNTPDPSKNKFDKKGMEARPVPFISHRFAWGGRGQNHFGQRGWNSSYSRRLLDSLILNGDPFLQNALLISSLSSKIHRFGEFNFGTDYKNNLYRTAYNLTIYKRNPWCGRFIQDELAMGKVTIIGRKKD